MVLGVNLAMLAAKRGESAKKCRILRLLRQTSDPGFFIAEPGFPLKGGHPALASSGPALNRPTRSGFPEKASSPWPPPQHHAPGLADHLRADPDPLSGHLFVFVNRRADRMKILLWDRSAFCLFYKCLEPGVLQVPSAIRVFFAGWRQSKDGLRYRGRSPSWCQDSFLSN